MDVERIAAGLTKAQREVVLSCKPRDWRRGIDFSYRAAQRLSWALRWPQLVQQKSDERSYFRLTPLGLAVRAHLLASRGRA